MPGSLTWADWDWLIDYTADGENVPYDAVLLHAPSPEAAAFFARDDWDAESWSGILPCGAESQAWGIPGVFSRLERERCPACCELIGYPTGVGSPKNDKGCRAVLEAGDA